MSNNKNLVPRSGIPESPLKNNKFTLFPQNNATNQVSRLNTRRNSNHLPGNITKVVYRDISALFSGKTLGVPETQLLDFVVLQHYLKNNHDNDPTVSFSLKEYMDARGLNDAKSARRSLKNGLNKLVSLQISYSGGSRNNPFNQSFGKHNLFSGYDYVRGAVTITLTQETNQLLTINQHAMLMPYSKAMFKLDPKKDASSWYILHKLLENKKENYGKSRADRMKISTLLENCPKLPTYEEVMHGNRHVNDRIIQPFFTAVAKLSSEFDYTFLTSDGQPFNYEEGVSYQEFANSELIITAWFDYPDDDLKRIVAKKEKYKKQNRQKSKKKTTKTN